MQPRDAVQELPKDLRRIVGEADLVQNTIGCSKALVFYIPHIRSYLKIAAYNDLEPLEYEAAVLQWLQGKAPVPKVHYYAKLGGREYLLISEIEGLDCSREEHRSHPEEMVRNLAAGLRRMHDLDISQCPLDQTLEVKLKKARSNLERGLVDENQFEPRYQGNRAEDLYALLLAQRPASQDLCFTHGDYCLPNIILKDGAVSGFIDLGRAGVADRYVDLALAVRSLQYNNYGSPRLVELFFEVYGLKEPDPAKMEFYTLLDEFS
jgi:aminoglycoside phosphotransferase